MTFVAPARRPQNSNTWESVEYPWRSPALRDLNDQGFWFTDDCGVINCTPIPSSNKAFGNMINSTARLISYDNLLNTTPKSPGHNFNSSHYEGSSEHNQMHQRATPNHSQEAPQHQSMFDLDRPRNPDQHNTSKDQLYSYASDHSYHSVQWISNHAERMDVRAESTAAFVRYTIQELMQQDCSMCPVNYPVDAPSRLVRVECRKPGCRCVLKSEPALALKVVPNVTLVQGEWSHSGRVLIHSKKGYYANSNHLDLVTSKLPPPSHISAAVVLTTCCPSWFELISGSQGGSNDANSLIYPSVPVWSSSKAVWRAKPEYFVLLKQTPCFLALRRQSILTSSLDVSNQNQTMISIDVDNVVYLKSGAVLKLIDCFTCRLVHHQASIQNPHASNSLLSRHHVKTASMLQCVVVGDKALSSVASAALDLPAHDALHWFSDGPKLVYLSLELKSLCCSPVSVKIPVHGQLHSNQSSEVGEAGVYSIISLLTHNKLPMVVRPVTCLRQSDLTIVSQINEDQSGETDQFSNQPVLRLGTCYHGDLIFLEPISECLDPVKIAQNSNYGGGEQNASLNSRFFVVTTDMLSQHNFCVLDSLCCPQYDRELNVHAARVAHFLAACHPAESLAYLLRHLEDITQSSTTGPSHVPLSRTLGPVGSVSAYAVVQAAIASVAAAAKLATEDKSEGEVDPIYSHELLYDETCGHRRPASLHKNQRFQSASCLTDSGRHSSCMSSSLLAMETDQMNAMCDELEDIYYYVRNGKFPVQSRSMTSLVHHFTPPIRGERAPLTSAPISPQPLKATHDLRKWIPNNSPSGRPSAYWLQLQNLRYINSDKPTAVFDQNRTDRGSNNIVQNGSHVTQYAALASGGYAISPEKQAVVQSQFAHAHIPARFVNPAIRNENLSTLERICRPSRVLLNRNIPAAAKLPTILTSSVSQNLAPQGCTQIIMRPIKPSVPDSNSVPFVNSNHDQSIKHSHVIKSPIVQHSTVTSTPSCYSSTQIAGKCFASTSSLVTVHCPAVMTQSLHIGMSKNGTSGSNASSFVNVTQTSTQQAVSESQHCNSPVYDPNSFKPMEVTWKKYPFVHVIQQSKIPSSRPSHTTHNLMSYSAVSVGRSNSQLRLHEGYIDTPRTSFVVTTDKHTYPDNSRTKHSTSKNAAGCNCLTKHSTFVGTCQDASKSIYKIACSTGEQVGLSCAVQSYNEKQRLSYIVNNSDHCVPKANYASIPSYVNQ
ncbi:unnamed protein product [Dicrocoelium dendriticum]|nr:unnamed protein product [Dicrocoelium dendriticum]